MSPFETGCHSSGSFSSHLLRGGDTSSDVERPSARSTAIYKTSSIGSRLYRDQTACGTAIVSSARQASSDRRRK